MKILIFSPYIPKHFGGGEKYIFDVATELANDHQVYLSIPNLEDWQKAKYLYESFLGYSLDKIKAIVTPLRSKSSLIFKILWTKNFDVIYYLTDGSLFFSLAKKNILHIQVPLLLDKSSLSERLKLNNWSIKNTNSFFTKTVIENSWQTKINYVHQPMISLKELSPTPKQLQMKENIILNVGRFFKQLHSKKQDILVKMFRELSADIDKSWRLVFIGAIEDESYFEEVKLLAKGLRIEFHTNINRSELINWYKKSNIYWHAAGYGINPSTNPEQVEHFGITTLEAMGAGCVPIVINKGGQPEILGEGLKSLLWNETSQALVLTKKMISDIHRRKILQVLAINRSKYFDGTRFRDILSDMVLGIRKTNEHD